MLVKEKILEILSKELSNLEQKFFVSNIGLFGSYSRGTENENSDIDLLIEFSKPVGFFLYMKLEDYLSNLFEKKVEIVTKNALKKQIKDKILRDVVHVST